MNPRWTDPCSVDVVMWATGASAEIAREYLIAEEGDIDNAIISYKTDFPQQSSDK